MDILWCITGAGHLLEETCKVLNHINDNKNTNNKKIKTCAISSAGEEVLKMYGIEINIEEKIFESMQGKSFPFCGRVSKKEYDAIIVAPCTSNTIAKLSYGISDSLITSIVTQGLKSGIKIYILPTDIKENITKIPMTVEYEKCEFKKICEICEALKKCKNNAIYISNNKIRIDLLKCNCCKECLKFCKFNAISYGKEIHVTPRKIDIENIKRVKEQNIKILKNIEELKLIFE